MNAEETAKLITELNPRQLVMTAVRNQAHRIRGGATRGGHRTTTQPETKVTAHVRGIVDVLSPHVGAVAGKVGLEIGPGDNLGVCRSFLELGAARMYAVEKYAAPGGDENLRVVRSTIEEMDVPEPLDFAISHDVLEHVLSVPATFNRIFRALRPGGVFVSSVDLRGHNCFNRPSRPLDFLMCPDWLWPVLFSHMETTNRVRFSDLTAAAKAAGFTVERADALAMADPSYVESIRPQLLPRYRALPAADLGVVQALIVARRPAG